MPKTLLGKCLFMFIGCAACATLMMDGLNAYGYLYDCYQEKKKLKESERMEHDEMVSEDLD